MESVKKFKMLEIQQSGNAHQLPDIDRSLAISGLLLQFGVSNLQIHSIRKSKSENRNYEFANLTSARKIGELCVLPQRDHKLEIQKLQQELAPQITPRN